MTGRGKKKNFLLLFRIFVIDFKTIPNAVYRFDLPAFDLVRIDFLPNTLYLRIDGTGIAEIIIPPDGRKNLFA